MPAAVETMASAREVPWHGIGVITEDVMTAEEALNASGLNWDVELRPVYTLTGGADFEKPLKDDFILVPDRYTVVRETDNQVLGNVGSNYVPLQNRDAFQFMDNIVDDGSAKYETAGSLKGGKQIWLTTKLPQTMQVAGVDEIETYILLTNSHDGSRAVTAAVTPVRVVCQNTLNLALSGARRSWSVRHLSNVKGKVQEARDSLDLTFKYLETFEKTANELATRKFTEADFDRWLEKATEEFVMSESKAEDAKITIKTLYMDAENLANVRGTRWAALNAVGEYFDWYRPRTDEARVKNTWEGISRVSRDKALQLLKV